MKRMADITPSQRQALAIATVIALVFGAYFLRHYFTLIIFAAIMAFLFDPIYQRLLRRSGKPGKAAALTFLIATVVILVPLILLVLLTGFQVDHLIHTAQTSVSSTDVSNAAQRIINSINDVLARFTSFRVTPEWIRAEVSDWLQKVGTSFLNSLTSYLGNFFSFFTTAIIFIFVFLSLLKNQATLLQMVRRLNPLGEEISDLYTSRIAVMTKAMVRGQFIVAIAQGLTDAALIYIGGLHAGFFFFALILIALSFIPLGGGILAIPVGIIMALTGNVVGGIIVVGGHLLIVTNIDNVLRPRLVPKEARLDPALTILSVFSGIALLGFLGIVVGPVIMITIVTTIAVYLEVYRNVAMETAAEGSDDGGGGPFKRVKRWGKGLFRRPAA